MEEKSNTSEKSDNISVISYNTDVLSEINTIDEGLFTQKSGNLVNWVDVKSLHDADTVRLIGKGLDLHHLIVEDILNIKQMVKLDSYEDSLFMVLKMLSFDRQTLNLKSEHVSIVLKGNYLISFQEKGTDIFSGLKEKITEGRENIRKFGAGYLCYELINTVVDNYFNVTDSIGEAIDKVEEELMSSPSKSMLRKIYLIKRELMYLRKTVHPLRELIGQLTRYDSILKSPNTDMYLRDLYDHLIQVVDTIETFQDIMSNMLDIYLSSIGNKTNDTMKILTIFSTIFIPLTFLAGVYGMNFRNIPELDFKYGYLIFWGICVVLAVIMLIFFKKKKWIK
jgi:magnesium transporter